MARTTKNKKDQTSLIISIGLHILLVGGVAFWAYKTGKLEQIRRAVLQYVRPEKKQEKKDEPIQQRAAPPKLPPINQGMPPTAASGTRRAVAADAPEAPGGQSFFQDTRRQGQGPATSGTGGPAKPTQIKVIAPPPPPRPSFRPAATSTIKQLLVERAKEAASTEAFGAEQISKTGVSDAAAILNKVSGASIVDGKFAVIRGLSDRYVTTTLNGAEVPSADPYRRSASLDLFPAQIINKVVVAKTFTPDQPGTYTGGGINIVTKSFPERAFLSLSLGGSYNTQASLNHDFLTYKGGGLDWAGIDDGTRALPPGLAAPGLVVPNPPFTTGPLTSPTYDQRHAEAERLQALTREMGVTQFAPNREAPLLNYNFSLATGDTTHMFGQPFGVFAGVSYRREFAFYTDGIYRRYAPGATPGDFIVRKDYSDTKAVDTVNWSGMVNLAYQLHDDHELGFTFLYNQNAEDVARQQQGTSQDDPGATFFLNRLHFTERNLNTFQLKGTHRLPELANIRLDWLGALSQTTQEEPDTRFFNYVKEGDSFEVGKSSVPDPKNPTRYFRNLDESNRNLKLDLTIPFRQWSWSEGEFKLGLFESSSDRTFLDREVYYQGNAPFNGDPNTFLTPGNLGYTATTNLANGRITYDWNRYIQTRDSAYTGDFGSQAGYLMLDTPVVENLRLIGGVRYETTDLSVNSRSYLANSVTGKTTNNSALNQVDLLPAAGLVYALTTNMNLRLSYSHTIARPSFRELAGYRSYDPVLEDLLDGNPNLKMSEIKNYDFRWEWFLRPGELLSVSFFYKDLKNAIERRYVTIDAEIITFANRKTASVYGVEFEARKNLDFLDPLLNCFSVGGNLSFIQSEVKLTPEELAAKEPRVPGTKPTRPLYDQSPYILNLDLSYDNIYSGTTATLVFNTAGPRITIASLNTEDVYEQPAPGLDFILSQKITRSMTVRFSARNLLDPKIERTYGKESNLLYSSYKRGMTFGLAVNYDF
jgi:TonB-dependent receptor